MSWLQKKYIDLVSVQLPKFHWIKPTVATFRCVFCGDSQRNQNKTRGYLYEKGTGWWCKCHNCGIAVSFSRLLKTVDPGLHREFVFESVKETGTTRQRVVPTLVTSFTIPDSRISNKPTLPTIADLPDDHHAVEYVEQRDIPVHQWSRLWYTENWRDWLTGIGWDPGEPPPDWVQDGPRLVIPFFNERRQLVAAQGRALFKTGTKNRYLTAKADENVLKVYGRDEWDPEQPTWVCEGPLDSLFLPNGLAVAGADILPIAQALSLEPKRTTVVFDNEPRNVAILAQMEKVIDAGYSIVVWSSVVHDKDINDLALKFPDQYQDMLSQWVYRGVRARMELSRWRRDDRKFCHKRP